MISLKHFSILSLGRRYFSFFLLALAFVCNRSYSQTTGIKQVVSSMDIMNDRLPTEKVYLQLDKPNYLTNDTIWFKAYLLNASLKSSNRSGILYLELADDSNEVIRRMKFPIQYGLGWGQVELDEDFAEGAYTIRAYTNWMRNFGEETIFSKRIYIATPSDENWLVSTGLSDAGRKDTKNLFVQFNKLDKQPIGLRELELRVMDGKRTLYKSRLNTTPEGIVNLDFVLPNNSDTKNVSLIATELKRGGNNKKLVVPLSMERPENMDLQFMPEGGHLVAGLPSRVGFKAIGENGRGLDVEGKILGKENREIASFNSLHKGMGSVELTPQAEELYTAEIKLPDGTTKSYPLPQVKASGTVLGINNPVNGDSLEVNVYASADSLSSYYLIGQAGGKVPYSETVHLDKGTFKTAIAKSVFPTGITRFTLLAKTNQPLNERIVFINHNDHLNIAVTPDTPVYQSRDSIALVINVSDKKGDPVQGSFSLSVTDDNQVKIDSIANANILTHLLLSSDLRGNIEEPNYYTRPGPDAQSALDNLLLVQGWTGYDWGNVFSPKPVQYAAEREFIINGRINNGIKGIRNTKVLLYSQKPFLLRNTLTDPEGRFTFKDLPLTDTANYFIQSWRRGGGSFLTTLTVDQFQAPTFASIGQQMPPWYVNSDSTLLENMKLAIKRQKVLDQFPPGLNVLDEVTITSKLGLVQAVDEAELVKRGNMTLWEFMHKYIGGFRYGSSFGPGSRAQRSVIIEGFWINDKLITFKCDNKIIVPEPWETMWSCIYAWFNYLTVQEITSIKVITTKTNARINFTTRAGQGLLMKVPGTFVYRPVPQFSFPKQFYSPKYSVKNSTDTDPDLRFTLHWEPNVITDVSGKAIVSFYAADLPSTYTVTVEGGDINGKVGSVIKEGLIKIDPPKQDNN